MGSLWLLKRWEKDCSPQPGVAQARIIDLEGFGRLHKMSRTAAGAVQVLRHRPRWR